MDRISGHRLDAVSPLHWLSARLSAIIAERLWLRRRTSFVCIVDQLVGINKCDTNPIEWMPEPNVSFQVLERVLHYKSHN